MSFITTNPNNFILNLPELQNVINSATGVSATATFLDTAAASLQINTITSYLNNDFITIQTDTNYSNASIYTNGSQTLTSNSLNGTSYLAFQVNGTELARLTETGLGIQTTDPATSFDITGDTLIRGNLYVSTLGVNTGNGFIDGNLQVGSITYVSDPILKEDIQPYCVSNMPNPVSFTWKSRGKRDIGVLATDVLEIEPACVHIQDGVKTVDYPKMVILCLAELKSLRKQVETLKAQVAELQVEHFVVQ